MANVAVKFYGEANSDGLPADWPSEVIQLDESEELPGEDWILMTVEEFEAYKVEKKTKYDDAIAPKLLAAAKVLKITQLQEAANLFLDSHYPLLTRLQLMNLYTLAKFDALNNRAIYIRKGIDWINSLTTYVLIRVGTINAQTTVSAVNAVAWNFAGNLGPDPALTLIGALSIVD